MLFSNFQNLMYCEKYLKDNKTQHSSLHLVQKYACINVLGHYLFLKLTVFLESCSWKTVGFSEEMMSVDKHPCMVRMHILAPNRGYCLYII